MAVPLDPKRAFDVTASDAAAVFGENPFQTRRQVLFSKIFAMPFAGNEATEWGKRYEPVAIAKYRKMTGAVVTYPGYRRHAAHPWFGGTIDGLSALPDGRVVILEVKCPMKRTFADGDDVPGQYVAQVQSYMELYDAEECHFVQYKPPGPRSPEKFTVTVCERDREYMALRMPRLQDFWREMTYMTAFSVRVVVRVQRAWRSRHVARRSAALRGTLVSACIAGAKRMGQFAGPAIFSGPAWPVIVEVATHPLAQVRPSVPEKRGTTVYISLFF
jgi:putative phage-type endonuclease